MGCEKVKMIYVTSDRDLWRVILMCGNVTISERWYRISDLWRSDTL